MPDDHDGAFDPGPIGTGRSEESEPDDEDLEEDDPGEIGTGEEEEEEE